MRASAVDADPEELSQGALYSVELKSFCLSNQNDQSIIATRLHNEIHFSTTRRLTKHLKLIFVITVPLAAMMSALTLSKLSGILDKTTLAIESIGSGMELSKLVKHLQRERGMSTFYLISINSPVIIFTELERLRKETNQSAKIVKWPNALIVNNVKITNDDFFVSIQHHRGAVDSKTIDIALNLNYYTMITTSLIKYITKSVSPSENTDVQKLLVANGAILSWADVVGIQQAVGTTFFVYCGWISVDIEMYFKILEGKAITFYETVLSYASDIKTSINNSRAESSNLSLFVNSLQNLSLFQNYKLKCSVFLFAERVEISRTWFFNMTRYIDTFFSIHEENNLKIKTILREVRSVNSLEFQIFLTTLTVASIASIVLSFWYMNCIAILNGNLSKFAMEARNKIENLLREKKRIDNVLYQLLPRKVANTLKRGLLTPPEYFEAVTVLFSDIVDFTAIGTLSEPMEIISMLDDLYSLFDECIDTLDVFKVETIGDAYMVASGVPVSNGFRHAAEIAMFAIKIRLEVRKYKIPHMPGRNLQLRIGIHTGPCVAGIVGTKMPRYCLLGDTVTTASRMESCGKSGKIHISRSTNIVFNEEGKFYTKFRGITDIQEKGPMPTYWLEGYQVKSEAHDDRVKYYESAYL